MGTDFWAPPHFLAPREGVAVDRRGRYLPGFGRFRDALPGDLRHRLKQRFKSNDAQKPTWREVDRQWVIEQLEADTKAALEFAGKPVDTYKWDTA